MAILKIEKVAIKGLTACVPKNREDNKDFPLFKGDEFDKFFEATGIRYRNIAPKGVCASDLCFKAARKLLEGLDWDPLTIDCLIFVTQTPDYVLPATSCILQDRLGISKNCFCFDVSLGCSGWGYGLNIISSLISNGNMKRGLLLVGDTLSRTNSRLDRISWPLFGDAGSATAFEYDTNAPVIYSFSATDGSGAEAIMMPDGGYRNGFTEESLKLVADEDGNLKNRLCGNMNGMDVFSFAISKVPKSIKQLKEECGIDQADIDYYVLHQGNKMMDEMILKKVKAEPEKRLYSLGEYGNTSGASIPLTISHSLHDTLSNRSVRIITSGFGVGLSWSTAYITLNNVYCPDIINLE